MTFYITVAVGEHVLYFLDRQQVRGFKKLISNDITVTQEKKNDTTSNRYLADVILFDA